MTYRTKPFMILHEGFFHGYLLPRLRQQGDFFGGGRHMIAGAGRSKADPDDTFRCRVQRLVSERRTLNAACDVDAAIEQCLRNPSCRLIDYVKSNGRHPTAGIVGSVDDRIRQRSNPILDVLRKSACLFKSLGLRWFA